VTSGIRVNQNPTPMSR